MARRKLTELARYLHQITASQTGNGLTDTELVTELYLWCLARNPRPEEIKVSLDFFKQYGDKRTEAAQDLAWALLNSKDFLLVH